jgi:hypothetical protein
MQGYAVSEKIDETLFIETAGVADTLVDEKPDSRGHISRLIIMKTKRNDLIKLIQTSLGAKLSENQPSACVASAKLLRDWLRSGYTAADEPECRSRRPRRQSQLAARWAGAHEMRGGHTTAAPRQCATPLTV